MQFDGGTVGWLAYPDVQVFALTRFEKEHIIAVVEISELVQLVELCFRVKLGVLAAVREEGMEIVEEMSVTDRRASLVAPKADLQVRAGAHR